MKLIHPQITNVADKTFLAMIKDLNFEFDDINVDAQFLSELGKIIDHYDTRTSIEEVEAAKILIEKINLVNVFNWQPYFHAMALQCDIQLPISAVKVFRFLVQQIIAEAKKSAFRRQTMVSSFPVVTRHIL